MEGGGSPPTGLGGLGAGGLEDFNFTAQNPQKPPSDPAAGHGVCPKLVPCTVPQPVSASLFSFLAFGLGLPYHLSRLAEANL